MPEFIYKASDRSGKVIEGSLSADDQGEVVSKLRGMGYIPIRIDTATGGKKLSRSISLSVDVPNPFKRVSGKDLLAFTQQLSTLIKAGLPLDRSLSIVVETTDNEELKSIAQAVLKDVRGGKSLSEALAQHPRTFNKLYVNMIKAGEAGGVMDVVLERLVEFFERSEELKSTVVGAMIYPLIIICVMGAAVAFMMIWLVPKFQGIFEGMGKDLPGSTQLLLTLSTMVQSYWWLILGIAILLYVWFRKYTSTENGRLKWDTFKLRLVILKDLITKIEVARFSRTLGTLMTSGVPLLQALTIVKEVVGNVIISQSINSVHRAVKEGKGVYLPLKNTGVFPSLAIHMIRVGEESGMMEDMLLRVAETYDTEVKNAIQQALSILQPALIIVMALMVLSIIIPILMAIISLNDITF